MDISAGLGLGLGCTTGTGRGRGRRDLAEDGFGDLRRPHVDPPEVRAPQPQAALGLGLSAFPEMTLAATTNNTRPIQMQVPIPYQIIQNHNQIPEYLNDARFANQVSNVLSSMSISDNTVPESNLASTLSADAPEFIPSFPSQPQIGSLRLSSTPNNYSLPQQPPHVNSTMASEVPVGDQNVLNMSCPQLKYINHPVILQVNNIVVNLTMKPHKFDQIATQMTWILSRKVRDGGLMKEIVSVIFEQGVGEPNFRFNGGRLYQYLSKHVTQAYDGVAFKNIVLQKCQEEFQCKDFYLQNEPARLCGFTLFMADIFTHLLTPTQQPLNILRIGLCDLLTTLMTNPTSTNLKCVAHVLKGSGRYLDASGDCMQVEKVMFKLKDVVMTTKLQPNIQTLLLSVIELRASNWGRGSGEAVEKPPAAPADPVLPPIGTVYYGPGGIIQRIEDENEDSASDTDDSCYGFNVPADELEGDEALAFEEFLREQQQPQQPWSRGSKN